METIELQEIGTEETKKKTIAFSWTDQTLVSELLKAVQASVIFIGKYRALANRTIQYYFDLDPTAPFFYKPENPTTENQIIQLLVRDVKYEYHTLSVPSSLTAANLMRTVGQWFHIDTKSTYCMTLNKSPIFDWKLNKTLKQLGLESEATVELTPNMRGGGGGGGTKFADLENKKGFETLEFSDKAPWYRTAFPGLCIEGKCKNKKCPAENCRVISNHRFGQFDLILDGPTVVECPVCYRSFEPITCAFNRCQWRWKGVKTQEQQEHTKKKKKKNTEPEPEPEQEWNHVGSKYLRFNESEGGSAMWNCLLLETIPLKEDDGFDFYSENYILTKS